MRVLVISDIHANVTALKTVLAVARGYDAVWCLGDVVGYGPNPNECVELLRQQPNLLCVLGNHDSAVIDEAEKLSFNPEARIAIDWTIENTTEDNKEFLRNVPKKIIRDHVTLVHGSPRDPVLEYLLDSYTATLNFAYFETPYGFFGHTHVPTIFHLNQGYADLYLPEIDVKFDLQARLLINPGSVGQPRDRDPRAAFAIYDTEANSWHFRRVSYDIAEVQDRMRALKLPNRHIKRLAEGL